MSYSDVQHFGTILSGCEAFSNGKGGSPDAVYALTVFRLHANDQGLVAGQEGFMDAVKKGAGNIKEWIKKLIQAIRDYFKSKEGKGSAEEVAIIKKVAQAPENKESGDGDEKKPSGMSKEDMFKLGWKSFATTFSQLSNKIGGIEDLSEELSGSPDNDTFIKRVESIKEDIESNPGNTSPVSDIMDLQNDFKAASEKITSLLAGKGDAFLSDEENKKVVSAAGKASVIYLECFKAIGSAFDSFAARSAEWHDKNK